MTNLPGLLALNEDVLVVPVKDLPAEARSQIDCNADDFAVSRVRGRGGSKIIDSEAADLLACFREPRTVVEAVILFGREKHIDPDKVLDSAYPFLRSLLAEGVLVPASSSDEYRPGQTRWEAGDPLLGGTIIRTIQVLDDTEIYLLRRHTGVCSIVKTERLRNPSVSDGVGRIKLERETEFLRHLGGGLAPELLDNGEIEGQIFLEMEFVHGVDVASAAAEWRERENQHGNLLDLVNSIARAYTGLHARCVLHADVHPRNVLVSKDGCVRLIDFGLAHSFENSKMACSIGAERGGVPFYFEPELARAYLFRQPTPTATPSGEQFAVAAMTYFLVTGNYWQDFRLGRDAMLEDIVGKSPLTFSERGVAPWPEMESVLGRALSHESSGRFSSMASFAEALSGVSWGVAPQVSRTNKFALEDVVSRILDAAGSEGTWLQEGLSPAPTCSITYGSAGVALGILHIALRRDDAELLALAETWGQRAIIEMTNEGAFYNPEIQITPEHVGKVSPYHSPSGVHAVSAYLSCAGGNSFSQAEATARFLEAVREPGEGLDLTLGRTSVLLGSALLLDLFAGPVNSVTQELLSLGNRTFADLWDTLDATPAIALGDIEYLGIAHGWAGYLYASLLWCRLSKQPIPSTVIRRLSELASLAIPSGRGFEWPWMLRGRGEPTTMAGWCNGSCGYVFLWTLAHSCLDDDVYLKLALGAGWSSWESSDGVGTLCCGVVGRSYALLNLYRCTGEQIWLDRARDLALKAAKAGRIPPDYPHSLYKGELGLAVLAADLERPNEARMPFFEPLGYRA